jgi:NADH-quinone oxidoreductase subunit E/NADP-reducing hydrogenase subunit HndA
MKNASLFLKNFLLFVDFYHFSIKSFFFHREKKKLLYSVDSFNKILYNNFVCNKLYHKEATMAHLQEAAVKKINEICDRYVQEKTPLMMILSDVQKEYGYIPLEVQEIISARTGLSVAEIYGVVTFYSFFSLTPKGKYVIGVCMGTACYVKGAGQIIDKFSEVLKIKPGETSEDGLFTLDALRCIGACGIAPAVTINGKVYPKLTVDAVPKIVAEYKAMEANA